MNLMPGSERRNNNATSPKSNLHVTEISYSAEIRNSSSQAAISKTSDISKEPLSVVLYKVIECHPLEISTHTHRDKHIEIF